MAANKFASNRLTDWLSYLETLHPKSISLGLERVSLVAQQLNLLPFPYPVITVAGTNGKGSCVALMENILLAQGYRVATYTSPHLLRYNERIRINGLEISDNELCAAFADVEAARGDILLTYFEFGTLAALLLFKQTTLDAVVLEIGMGGRLDAVNIIDPDVAIISTIDLDHMEWLGQDRETIAVEKAGIMRTNKPVVCGDFNIPNSIYNQANKLRAKLYCQQKDFSYQLHERVWSWQSHQQQLKNLPLPNIELQNAATVLQATELLPNNLPVSVEAIRQGLKQVFIPGRFQVFAEAVTTIVDVAHNPAAARLLAEQLKRQPSTGKTYAVVAMLQDKDMRNTLIALLKVIDAWFVAGLAVPRGGDSKLLAKQLKTLAVENHDEYATVSAAYKAALAQAQPNDRIIVFGSFYTAAEILQMKSS